MSRRQNPSSNPVPLFQFLDLFLCTIGTLIVMLVIMTTKIRQDTINRAIAERIVATETEVAVTPAPQIAPPLPSIPANPPEPDAAPSVDHHAAIADAMERLTELEGRSRALNSELSQRQRSISALEQQARLTVAETQAASASKKELERRLREAIGERNKELTDLQRLQAEQARLLEKILESQKLIAIAKKKEGNSEHVIVPYDGITGTTRRPIILECKGPSIRFVAEDVTVNILDMEPFRPGSDPLAAGIAELVQYWIGKAQANGTDKTEPRPYVLLVVRPSGLPAYLLTRRCLDATGIDFGYELVAEDFSYAAPETDPRAKQLCQAAVEQTIKDGPKAPTARVYVIDDGQGSGGGSGIGAGGARRSSPSRPPSSPRGSGGPTRGGSGNSATASRSGAVRQYGGIDSGALSRGGTGSMKFFSSSSFQDHRDQVEVGPEATATAKSTRRPGELQLSDDEAPLITAQAQVPAGADNTPQMVANIKPPPLGNGSEAEAAEPKSAGRAEPSAIEDIAPPPLKKPDTTLKSKSPARGGSSRPSRSQSSDEETMEEQVTESPLMKDRDIKNLTAFKRQWGIHNPKGSIALEKKLAVTLDGQKIIVGNRLKITRFEDRSNKQLADLTIQAMDEVAKDWGPPPEQFYWVPTVDLSVYSGGELITEPLRKALQQTGVVVNVLYQ